MSEEKRIKTLSMDFPSNSKTKETKEEKKVEKVVTGKVVRRKKPLAKKLSDTFIDDDVDTVKGYIFWDVIVPGIKNTIADVITDGIEMLLFGEARGRGAKHKRHGAYGKINYAAPLRPGRREASHRTRTTHDFDEFVLDSRAEANDVLTHLVDIVDTYGEASVYDLYELLGVTADHTDRKYGWTNLSASDVIRVRDGYIIKLPRTILLD